jgi:hypothetical protein
MTQRHHFDRDALVGEIHDQRRQHVARLDASGHQRFLDLRPAAVLAVLEAEGVLRDTARDAGFLGGAGHGQGEVAGHRQPTHDQRLAPVGLPAGAATHAQRQGGGQCSLENMSAVEDYAHAEGLLPAEPVIRMARSVADDRIVFDYERARHRSYNRHQYVIHHSY